MKSGQLPGRHNSLTLTGRGISRRRFLALAAAAGLCAPAAIGTTPSGRKPTFTQRGYYLLPCRTPTLGYDPSRQRRKSHPEHSGAGPGLDATLVR